MILVSFRRIRAMAAALLSVSASALFAQSPAPQKPPVTFSTVTITGNIRGLFYDIDRKQIPVAAGPTSMGGPYTAPASGVLHLYKLAPPVPPATEPVKVTVANLTLGDEGPYLLLFSGPVSENLQIRVLDNSWEKNPLLSSRVINTSRRKVAVKLDAGTAELAPGELHTFAPPAKPIDVIELKIATLDASNWNLRILTPQALYPYTRNTFILKEQIPSLENPTPEDLDIFSIVDASQPPPAPKP